MKTTIKTILILSITLSIATSSRTDLTDFYSKLIYRNLTYNISNGY